MVEPIVTGLGYEFVGVEYNPHPMNGLLRVYIDSQQGILLEDCAKVSHQVSGMLDVEDPIAGNYRLEVSSPGMDRPLFNPEQFIKFKSKMVSVTLFQPCLGRRKITGEIAGVESDSVKLIEKEQVFEIAFADIKGARLIPEYMIEKRKV